VVRIFGTGAAGPIVVVTGMCVTLALAFARRASVASEAT
jgi:hypothetical protein